MKCAVHPEVDATGYCSNCGKAMCAACARPVRDTLYCEDCLATRMGIGPTPASSFTPGSLPPGSSSPPGSYSAAPGNAARHTASNPRVAFVLGFVPGLGAIYNGEYNKAIIHIVIFGAIVMGLSSDIGGGLDAFLGIGLGGFIFYMAFDAMRVARARQTGETVPDPFQNWGSQRPIGPMILIGVGALFLLYNFGIFEMFHLRRVFWPLVLIGVGTLMLRNRMNEKS
jgi:hypothetical protein